MKIAIGADGQNGTTAAVVRAVQEAGHEVSLFGALATDRELWPLVAQDVAEAVASGEADEGVLICWTGTGVSIVANKVPGIRAALCVDPQTARGARLWNDANLICLSMRLTSEVVAEEILDSWFNTSYQPNEEDDTCLRAVGAVETLYRKAEAVESSAAS